MTYRSVKVEEFWTPRTRRGDPPKSKVRLKGKWLAEAGFSPGQRARVRVEPGRIVLLVAEGG